MSLVWIKQVANKSSHTVVLQQNDNTFHPVINSGGFFELPDTPYAKKGEIILFSDDPTLQVKKDERIVFRSKGHISCNHFVIPWQGHGRLRISSNTCGFRCVEVCVGHGKYGDHILFSPPIKYSIPVGLNGPFPNIELKLVITNKRVIFDILNIADITKHVYIDDKLRAQISKAAKQISARLFSVNYSG